MKMNVPLRPAVWVGAVLTLAVFGRFYAKPVLAQVRAALTQNVDEPGRNPYQQQFFSYLSNCQAGSQFCNFNFPAVPANSRLVLTNISGYVDMANAGQPNCNVESSLGGSTYASVSFTGTGTEISTTGARAFFNVATRAYFGAGEAPHGFCGFGSTNNSSGGDGFMTLTGY